VEIEGDATPQNTAALRGALQGFPDLALDTEAGWVEERASGLDMVLNLFYVLLALSVVVSLFGMVNTLVLSVFERTRELGMLRAVGMTRRQVRRMVRQESVITALIGAAVGLRSGRSWRRSCRTRWRTRGSASRSPGASWWPSRSSQ
jgi:putative ABC transport system permease protein